jgi:hypothetical protein
MPRREECSGDCDIAVCCPETDLDVLRVISMRRGPNAIYANAAGLGDPKRVHEVYRRPPNSLG